MLYHCIFTGQASEQTRQYHLFLSAKFPENITREEDGHGHGHGKVVWVDPRVLHKDWLDVFNRVTSRLAYQTAWRTPRLNARSNPQCCLHPISVVPPGPLNAAALDSKFSWAGMALATKTTDETGTGAGTGTGTGTGAGTGTGEFTGLGGTSLKHWLRQKIKMRG